MRGLEEAACDSAARVSQARATGRCLRAGHTSITHPSQSERALAHAHKAMQRIEFAHGGRRISKPAMGTGDPATAHMCIDQLRGIRMDGRCVFSGSERSKRALTATAHKQSRTGPRRSRVVVCRRQEHCCLQPDKRRGDVFVARSSIGFLPMPLRF